MYRESVEISQIVARISSTTTPIRTHAVCPGYSEERNSRIWAIEDPKVLIIETTLLNLKGTNPLLIPGHESPPRCL
jgi:hypothetical protein